MIFWTVATWVLTPLLLAQFGFNGVSIAQAVIALSSLFVMVIAKRYITFRVLPVILPPLIGTVLMGGLLYFLSPYLVKNFPTFFLAIALGGISYIAVLFLIARQQVVSDIQLVVSNLKK
jgi:O-antigen/teichoic acid export membrane protein